MVIWINEGNSVGIWIDQFQIKPCESFIRTLVCDYEWIHLAIGVLGNAAFLVGSILFLPQFDALQTTGVWLFIIGAFFMLVGSVGQFFVSLWRS
jgi:hypothetical protein